MNVISITLIDEQINKLKEQFSDELVLNTPNHALFQIKTENCIITAYKSKKVVFQGKDASIYASAFNNNVVTNKESKPIYNHKALYEHAGSDEVGTGDYFGPVVVCATIIEEKDFELINSLNVCDSKQIKDDEILEIAPKLIEQLKYSLLILDNEKYNEIHKFNNLNVIKAKLHNKAYLNLLNKYNSLPKLCVIDQFTPEKNYYGYLKQEEKVFNRIHFETKAENKYPAVAAASIIARYAFIKSFKNIEDTYNIKLTKGSGNKVDQDIIAFYNKYGINELTKVAKIHFKNTNVINQ